MATLNLPYPGMNFVPLDVLTAAELNQMVANDNAIKNFSNNLADGSAVSDNAIPAKGLSPAARGDYTTAEVNTGIKWVDGKDIYRRTITFYVNGSTDEQRYTMPLGTAARLTKVEGIFWADTVDGWQDYYPLEYSNPKARDRQNFDLKAAYNVTSKVWEARYIIGTRGTMYLTVWYVK